MPRSSNEWQRTLAKREQEKIKWAVGLAQRETDNLREWEVLKLREELMSFIVRGAVTGGKLAVPLEGPFPKDYKQEDFKKLSDEFWEIFHSLIAGKNPGIKFGGDIYCNLLVIMPGRTIAQFQGSTRDMAIMKLIELLTHSSMVQVKKCANRNCNQFFFKIKRQEYHDRKCMLEARQEKIKRKKRQGGNRKKGREAQ